MLTSNFDKVPLASAIKKSVVFAGAGISFNSGLPMAKPLTKQILLNLPFHVRDMALIASRRLPFEVFIQTIHKQIPIDEILEIFQSNKPNTNHHLLALLAKHNFLKLVVTTNFDNLIEEALMQENVAFRKIYDFSNLERFRLTVKTTLIKIHGSIDDKESIAIIIDKITQKAASKSVKNIIRKVFFQGTHNNIIFLGYSCSDFFDIVPEIEKSFRTKKTVYLINMLRII